MPDTVGLRQLKNVVKKTIWMANADEGAYKKFFQLCIDGYRELRLHHVNEGLKVTKHTPDSDLNSVDYPSDLVTLVDVGEPREGQIWSLTREDKIVTTTSTVGGNEVYNSDIGEGEDLLSIYWNGFNSRGGVNTEGYYKDDVQNRRVLLRNTTATTIWLLYVTSGTDLSGATSIPVKYENTLVAYILYNNAVYDPNMPAPLVERYKAKYMEELINLRKSERPSLQVIWDTLNKTDIPLPTR
jgi:hypothetical protein